MPSSVRPRLSPRLAILLALVLAPPLGWAAYAGLTWWRFDEAAEVGGDATLQGFMPRADIAEVHRTRVAAPAPAAFDAALAMDLHRSTVVHAIFRARELMLGAHAPPRVPRGLVDELRALGWGVLAVEPGRRIVLGAVTQPWEADVRFRALPPASFASFDSAGYVKIVVSFVADSTGARTSELRTETRALATDAVSRARFRRYWATFSPGILLIRSRALAVARRDAEGR